MSCNDDMVPSRVAQRLASAPVVMLTRLLRGAPQCGPPVPLTAREAVSHLYRSYAVRNGGRSAGLE